MRDDSVGAKDANAGVDVMSTSGVARTSGFRIGRETRARRVSFAKAKRATAAAATAAPSRVARAHCAGALRRRRRHRRQQEAVGWERVCFVAADALVSKQCDSQHADVPQQLAPRASLARSPPRILLASRPDR
jgi:hypothetical protein